MLFKDQKINCEFKTNCQPKNAILGYYKVSFNAQKTLGNKKIWVLLLMNSFNKTEAAVFFLKILFFCVSHNNTSVESIILRNKGSIPFPNPFI